MKKSDTPKTRRQFLKNTSLAALALGISPTITAANSAEKTAKTNAPICDKTTVDYYGEGPFYTENPPTIADSQLADADEAGERMIISGRVYNLDCNQFIPNAVIDIWHADDAGQYDNQGYRLRGKTLSNEQGFYMFETIKPGKYLNGSQYRPAHIHFKITAPNFEPLTTQLYFEGDTDIPADAAASINSGNYDATHRIIPLSTNGDGKLEGTWDIVVNGNGVTTGIVDVHLNKGMIYKAQPNPFSDTIKIKYGVFRAAKVSLFIYDIQGKIVANLSERTLQPEKYEANWQPDTALPNGHYFVALKINDMQVHYLKIFRQK